MANEKKLTSRQQQATEMKQKIYETTVVLYQNKPYEDVTISDICKSAGISTGNFYHYFKSKDDVLNEGFQIMKRNLAEKMEGISLPPLERIYYATELYAQAIERRGYRFMSIFMHNELLQLIPYKNNFDRTVYSFILEALEEAFSSGKLINGNPTTLHANIFRLYKGVTYDWCINQAEFALEPEILRVLELILAPHRPTK